MCDRYDASGLARPKDRPFTPKRLRARTPPELFGHSVRELDDSGVWKEGGRLIYRCPIPQRGKVSCQPAALVRAQAATVLGHNYIISVIYGANDIPSQAQSHSYFLWASAERSWDRRCLMSCDHVACGTANVLKVARSTKGRPASSMLCMA